MSLGHDGALPDPVYDYAIDVLEERIPAGPDVRAACQRFLDDLMNADAKGFYWDLETALEKMLWFEDELRVEVPDEKQAEPGEEKSQPFILMDFQAFIVGNIFGWKWKASGFRRFRAAYVECGKGSGKSPLAAGIGLLMGLEDGESKPEIYSAGAKKEQSKVLFRDACAMVEASNNISAVCRVMGGEDPRRIVFPDGYFEPVSADKKKSGPRPHCALIDELHEHGDRYTVDMMQDGFKRRTQPLLFIITNSGFDRTSICWEWHKKALDVVHGIVEDETLFVMVFSLDVADDPLEDETCWAKTNPGIGQTITYEYLAKQVADARQVPGRENPVRRLNFCQWTEADTGWMTRNAWTSNEAVLGHYEKGRFISPAFAPDADGNRAVCVIALDLSFSFDMTAMAFAFEDGPKICTWVEYFTPRDTIAERERRDSVPYAQWVQEGYIHATPGSVVPMEYIANRLHEVSQIYEIEIVAYDKYRHKDLDAQLSEYSVNAPMIEHPQGFRRAGQLPFPKYRGKDGKPLDNPLWMPESVRLTEQAILEHSLEVQPSPVTRWQVSSVAVREDPSGVGNTVLDKRKSTGRIDGIVAKVMAIGAAKAEIPAMMDFSAFLKNPVRTR